MWKRTMALHPLPCLHPGQQYPSLVSRSELTPFSGWQWWLLWWIDDDNHDGGDYDDNDNDDDYVDATFLRFASPPTWTLSVTRHKMYLDDEVWQDWQLEKYLTWRRERSPLRWPSLRSRWSAATSNRANFRRRSQPSGLQSRCIPRC